MWILVQLDINYRINSVLLFIKLRNSRCNDLLLTKSRNRWKIFCFKVDIRIPLESVGKIISVGNSQWAILWSSVVTHQRQTDCAPISIILTAARLWLSLRYYKHGKTLVYTWMCTAMSTLQKHYKRIGISVNIMRSDINNRINSILPFRSLRNSKCDDLLFTYMVQSIWACTKREFPVHA